MQQNLSPRDFKNRPVWPYWLLPIRRCSQATICTNKNFFSTWLLQQRKGKSDKTDLKRDYKFFEHLLSDRFRHQNTFASFFSFLPSFLPSLHYTLLSLQFYRKNFSWCKNGCRHSSVDSSAPTILLPWVWVPSTPSTLLSFIVKFVLYFFHVKRTKVRKKEAGFRPFFKK